MKETLVICLSNLDEISLLPGYLYSLHVQEERNITVLIYQKHKKIIETLDINLKILPLEHEKIKSILKSQVISNDEALNTLYNDIDPIVSKNWDECFHISSNRPSSYLASLVSTNRFYGQKYTNQLVLESNNEWCSIKRHLKTTQIRGAISSKDILHNISNTPISRMVPPLKINEDMYSVSNKNLKNIRKKALHDEDKKEIIGVFINPENSDISNYVRIIDHISTSTEFYPVLINLSDNKSCQISDSINFEFNNTLIAITTSLHNIHLVLMGISGLVTDSTGIANISVSSRCRTVAVLSSQSELSKLEDSDYLRAITLSSDDKNVQTLSRDIEVSLHNLIHKTPLRGLTQNKVYTIKSDIVGVRYNCLSHPKTNEDLSLDLIRVFISSLLNKNHDNMTIKEIFSEYDKEQSKDFLLKEKEAITNASRLILNSLRLLKSEREEDFPSPNFTKQINDLISSVSGQQISSIPLLLFRDLMGGLGLEKNLLEAVENGLYNMKTQYKLLINIISQILEDGHTTYKKISTEATPEARTQDV